MSDEVPDDRAWMGSGVGRDADGALRVYCDAGGHPVRDVRRLRRSEGAGWWINPNVDSHQMDPITGGADGSVRYRTRVRVRCPDCDLGVELTGVPGTGTGALEILDRLVDGGVSEIGLTRLCALVSNWR